MFRSVLDCFIFFFQAEAGIRGDLVTGVQTCALPILLHLVPDCGVVFVGRGSVEFARQLASLHPDLGGRVTATGESPQAEVVSRLRACDLLLQPFPDGVSSRRTSAMAGLACGVPVVTNLGPSSEPVWAGATATVPTADPAALARLAAELLADRGARAALGARGAALYRDTFALAHTL